MTTSVDYAISSPPRLEDGNDIGRNTTAAVSIAQASSAREQAVVADSRTSMSINLALLWRELSLGLCKVVDAFFGGARCYLVTVPTAAPAKSIARRRLAILEAVLASSLQKRVAFELSLSPSTVAVNARLGLDFMGLRCYPSRVHPLLMLAATAARTQESSITGAVSFVTYGNEQLRVIAIQRPELALAKLLPPAEFAVIRSLIEGVGHAEIARRRNTSTRTIANQIAAVFRRLRVSGRSELVTELFSKGVLGDRPVNSRETRALKASTASARSCGREPARLRQRFE